MAEFPFIILIQCQIPYKIDTSTSCEPLDVMKQLFYAKQFPIAARNNIYFTNISSLIKNLNLFSMKKRKKKKMNTLNIL